MMIQASAGTGKSFLLTTLMLWCAVHKKNAKAAAPTAATGTSGREGAEGSWSPFGAAALTPPKFRATAGAAANAKTETFMFCLM